MVQRVCSAKTYSFLSRYPWATVSLMAGGLIGFLLFKHSWRAHKISVVSISYAQIGIDAVQHQLRFRLLVLSQAGQEPLSRLADGAKIRCSCGVRTAAAAESERQG